MISFAEVGAAQSGEAAEMFRQPPRPLGRFLAHIYFTYNSFYVISMVVIVVTGDVFPFRASHCLSFMFSRCVDIQVETDQSETVLAIRVPAAVIPNRYQTKFFAPMDRVPSEPLESGFTVALQNNTDHHCPPSKTQPITRDRK
jgi:hypothetical protein